MTPAETSEEVEEHLDELDALVQTLGPEVVDRIVQERNRIDPGTYIGSGKMEEIDARARAEDIDLLIFDVELSPAQKKNIEKPLPEKMEVLDRSQVILEIFARHARTHEAKTQVELAHLEYLLPRLTSRWSHLHRQRGGIGLRGGEGETQLEVDRRMTQKRIARLKKDLERIARQRETRSKGREDLFQVALVGYTNAGKSSLMNALTGAGVLVENQLFSTLDSTVRSWEVEGEPILLIDTVGFIRKLPHQLVASFRSTLQGAASSDLLLVVVDVDHPRFEEHLETTRRVLREMELQDHPRLLVFNKCDRLEADGRRERLERLEPDALFVSAASGEGLEELRERVLEAARAGFREEELVLPSGDGRAVAQIHQALEVLETAYQDGIVKLRARGRPAEIARARKLAEESLAAR